MTTIADRRSTHDELTQADHPNGEAVAFAAPSASATTAPEC
jgi:hypothetical protein